MSIFCVRVKIFRLYKTKLLEPFRGFSPFLQKTLAAPQKAAILNKNSGTVGRHHEHSPKIIQEFTF